MGRLRKEQENYISYTTAINRSQKAYAKDAVLWLLTRGTQTEADISEHFGLPVDVVSLIVEELEKSGRVQRQSGSQSQLKLKNPFR